MKLSTVEIVSLVHLLLLAFLVRKVFCVTDTITPAQVIRDGDTIISAGGGFELGFFSPSKSTNRYVGMWYKTVPIQTVVWVANREIPIVNTGGSLEIVKPGLLVIRNRTNGVIWSSNYSRTVLNPIAQLFDNGNLVVRDADDDNPENYIWQSFDYPTDTLLPGMKLGRNLVTGREVVFSSWKNFEDPAQGEYTKHCDPTGYPQNLERKGGIVIFRTAPWNGLGFSGEPGLTPNPIFSFGLVLDSKEVYYIYKLMGSTISRVTLSPSGVEQRWTWNNQTNSWKIYISTPNDECDTYGLCGPNGSCDLGNSAFCGCLAKFEPKDPENWSKGNWSDGCVRKTPLNCIKGDGFLKYQNYKLPDTHNSTYNTSLSLEECRKICLKNCSCTAYSSLDIRNGESGCLLWFGNLVDLKVIPGAGQDIYIRLAYSEIGKSTDSSNDSHGKKLKVLVTALMLSLGMVLLGLIILLCIIRRNKQQLEKQANFDDKHYMNERHYEKIELPLFDFSTLLQATNNFSSDYKLGEGGYGPVYWGKLEDGQEVAVKRLLKNNEHGVVQFTTEAICIAKLQHRNLVKLLGCCIQRDERILIYEYMPNKSLDFFIFDQRRSSSLDWSKRFHIIQGIARGLLYLHQDSRLRVVHRDLKAGNILLDADLNPKISDFGTARSFGGNETADNTIRVVGTHGYMAPEYAGNGLFSIKSDVFSFGVLVLEIISGKRNRMFVHEGHNLNTLGHAWRLNREGRALELVDANLTNSHCLTEVLRTIQVGLLCVQQCPEDRPDMSSVVFMLGSNTTLPEVTAPGFFVERNSRVSTEMTMTKLEAR